MRARAVIAAAAVVLVAVLPGTAWAHANLDRAEPAPGSQLDQPPRELQLFFSEAVDGSFSRVQLLNTRGDAVDRGDSHVAPNDPRSMAVSLPTQLPEGVYTVAWRTLSAVDGHTVNGAYPLIVGPIPAEGLPVAASATSSQATFAPETALGRWWFFVAASAVFGTLLSWQMVFRPLFGRTNPAALPVAAARSQRLAAGSALVLLIGTLYVAVAQAANAADVPIWAAIGQPLAELLSRGRFAGLWWARLALVVVALSLLAWRGVRRWPGQVALVASALALLTSSLNSHGAALLSGAYLGVAVDWLHFIGVAAWIGGLLSLMYVLPVAVHASQGTGERVLARAVGRFSTLALVAVCVIVITGIFQTWLEVGSWDGLIQTAYGLSVTAKIGLLVVMLLLAGFNLLIVRPALGRIAASGSSALGSALTRRFTLAVRGEVVLGVVILAIAAFLTGLAPARDELARRSGDVQSGPVDRQVDASGLNARIQITPAVLGINRLAVQLPGVDPAQVERVQLTFTYLDSELGSQPVVLPQSSSSPDTWTTTSALLSQAGTWQAEMLVRQTGQDDARTAVRFMVAGPGGAPQATSSVSGAYPLLPSAPVALAYALIGAGIVVAAVAVVRTVREPRRRRAFQRQAALVVAGVVILACGGYVYAAEQRNGVPLDVVNIRDPVPPDEHSLGIGRDVYTTYCQTCHGETGRGDGPSGLRLVPRPADLHIHMAPGVHTDGELYYWVSYGVTGTAMPAWKDHGLTDEQIWSVINYARATFGNS
ncbi:MAG TPA: CopD family protein [Chloroflexota bacterium]|nr:CopD family protein [Chloroflexota bacterium]